MFGLPYRLRDPLEVGETTDMSPKSGDAGRERWQSPVESFGIRSTALDNPLPSSTWGTASFDMASPMEAKCHRGKEVVPVALLYYCIDDSAVETLVELAEEEIKGQITKQLCMNGVVNSPLGIVELLDAQMGDRSM